MQSSSLNILANALLNLPPILKSDHFEGYDSFQLPELIGELAPFTFRNNLFGKQMEEVMSAVLERSTRYDIIGENLQIKQEKQTLGELDFVLMDQLTDRLIHLEMAIKFYVLPPDLKTYRLNEWIGPNRHDRLIDKLEKLFQKQLPFINHPCTQSSLHHLGVDEHPIDSQFLLKGMLFTPPLVDLVSSGINPKAIAGAVHYEKDWEKVTEPYDYVYFPTKLEWPLQLENCEHWQPKSETKNPALKAGSYMLWLKKGNIYHRCFMLDW